MKWSRWLTWLGAVIALAGVVITIWLQVVIPTGFGASAKTQLRLENAGLGIGMIGAGALLAVAAQIMGMMQAARTRPESN